MGALLPRGDRVRVACWTLGTLGGERVHFQVISPAVCEWMGTSEVGLWISLSDASRGDISQVNFLVWNFFSLHEAFRQLFAYLFAVIKQNEE